MEGIIDLFLHAMTFENRRRPVIELDPVSRAPRNLANHFDHSVSRLSIVADDVIDFFREKVAHGPFNQIGLLKNSARGRTLTNQLLDLGPLIEKETQIADKESRALSFSNGADDDADAFRNIKLAQDFAETIALF